MITRFNDGRDWFFQDRFGMFVHWGIYSVAGWHEQHQWRLDVPKADYVKLAERFNPVKFNPDEWLALAKAAGMRYLVITAKHHDGFCLWDTKQTSFNIMNTPYGQDVLKQLADACARQGVKLGIYYSCPDWHHPNSINQGTHHQLKRQNPGDQPDNLKYVEFVRRQIRELCSNYGPVHCFFWDIPPQHHDPSLNAMIRELQPQCVINDRGYDKGDYDTPERGVPACRAFTRPTEACDSVGVQSWGYREREDYAAPLQLMRSIDRIMAMGGNYLLNVGPKPDGTIPESATRTLRRVGAWYTRHQEALNAAPASVLSSNEEVMLTRQGDDLFVHFPNGLNATGVTLQPIDVLPERATLLNDGRGLETAVEITPRLWEARKPFLRLFGLPTETVLDEVPIAKLSFAPGVMKRLLASRPAAEAKEYLF